MLVLASKNLFAAILGLVETCIDLSQLLNPFLLSQVLPLYCIYSSLLKKLEYGNASNDSKIKITSNNKSLDIRSRTWTHISPILYNKYSLR